MKQDLLRAHLKLKRDMVRATSYRPGNSVSLYRHEKPNRVSHDVIGPYSASFAVEIYDPRSELIRGHYFQARNAHVLRNVIFEPRLGLVYTVEGELVEESTNWPIFQFYNSFPWNPKKNLTKLNLPSAIFLPSSAFGHWLMEDLSLTIFALSLDANAPILVAKNPPKYVCDFLKIVDREIIYLDGPVQISSLIIVQKNQDSGWPHPKDLETLRQYAPFLLTRQQSIPTRKIYTSRRGSKRSPGNESQIEEIFRDHGYEVFQMEHFDLMDEIRLMSETSVIAGVHGSSLANIVWMPPGGAMLDIANDNYWTEAGHRLAHLRESAYHSVIYKGEFNSNIESQEIEKAIVAMSRV